MQDFSTPSPEFFQDLFDRTVINRHPLKGIVKGYHRIPYVLVGPNDWEQSGSIELRGEIRVSPRLVYTFGPQNENFKEVFSEHEPIMDATLQSRTFRFRVAQFEKGQRIKIEGSTFSLLPHTDGDELVLAKVLEDFNASEIIDTGVIWCPHPRYYPVSLERFIYSILEQEFRQG